MNPLTQTRVSPAQLPSRAPNLFEKAVLQALERMPAGRLELHCPDGPVRWFGSGDGAGWQEHVAAPAARALPARACIRILRPDFFRKCVLRGDIGFAESYLDGDWETPSIPAVIAWFLLNLEHAPTLSGSRAGAIGLNLLRLADRIGHRLRPNSRAQAVRNIREHYDLSNDFFALWLDPSMMYSAARWERPEADLTEAQRAKNEALCRKLRLRPTDHVLEIGTGWGGWSLHAARHHGCRVTTLTLSRQQRDLAVRRVAAAGLSGRIEVRLQDYRDLGPAERFDKLVSIEMLEAVGHDYLGEWCRVASRALRPDGLLALQFITCPDARYASLRRGVDFIQKHVFPGSLLLSLNRLNALLSEEGGFVLHGLEDLGQDYARTLAEWRIRFQEQAAEVTAQGFDQRFVRKWNYYLGYCEAAFALRNISVVQTVHTRPNNLTFA
jgi:cyclopropane-fatty-acyl-phospholipid synthase